MTDRTHTSGSKRPSRPAGASSSRATAAKAERPVKSAGPSSRGGGRMVWRDAIEDWKSRPLSDYNLLLIIVGLLTGIGLVMVLSASMAKAGTESGNVWSVFIRQTGMVIFGLVAMWFVVRMRVEIIRRFSIVALLGSLVLLILVIIPGIGVGMEETGAQSWLNIGGMSVQPSEIAKIAMAMWGSKILADRTRTATTTKELFGVFGVVSAVILMLVLLQRDLGMVGSMSFVVLALAWFAGLPRWIVAAIGVSGVVLMVVFSVLESFRSARFRVYFDSLLGNFNDVRGDAYQSYQGFLSLADGSMTGVGLGQSNAKWFYLPEANNDFIFAIIGEELGFIGAGIVILLYAALGWVGLRISAKQVDPFLRLMAATVTAATVVQAFINIGYVVGVLPVTGLQLPLISAGGTSAFVTLASMGLLLTCARHEPEAISAMQTSGRPAIDRLLGIPEPIAYDPSARDPRPVRTHRETQRFGAPVSVAGVQERDDDPTGPRRSSGSGGHSNRANLNRQSRTERVERRQRRDRRDENRRNVDRRGVDRRDAPMFESNTRARGGDMYRQKQRDGRSVRPIGERRPVRDQRTSSMRRENRDYRQR
ncbi:putative lipid II flippase FtsW [Corynebacterium sp. H113]|uniref:putative lipid II flippase FtsW n=1 Tax=Corynebacterium sp. H113 TaxID=3133419 RepID=UPI00309BD8D3